MYPYDSMRDYVAELEKRNKIIRIKEIDQDIYESTALIYKMLERMGDKAPGFIAERTKANGKWFDTPVVGNIYNGYDTVALSFGVEDVSDISIDMYHATVKRLQSFYQPDSTWKQIEPVEVKKGKAPCKEVVLMGKDADVLKFPWIKNNPLDAAQYISAGSFVMSDPDIGKNVGTYRIHIKGSHKIGAYFTNQSHGYAMMMKAAERGEETVPVSIAVGLDPISWMMSSTRLADIGTDEFSVVGGFRGKPIELVKSETNDILVPAQAEFIIEGEIPMEAEEEGPYGEMFGYLGKETNTFFVNVKAITHRKNPWVFNIYTGAGSGYFTLPWDMGNYVRMKKLLPSLVNLYVPPNAPSTGIISIDKKFPGEGMEAGMFAIGYRTFGFGKKIMIVVDSDVDVADISRVLHAVSTRWQPVPASLLINNSFHMPLEPSSREMFMSSKIVIDATRQLPSEGGPDTFPPDLRTVLEERAPESFEVVEKKWETYFPK